MNFLLAATWIFFSQPNDYEPNPPAFVVGCNQMPDNAQNVAFGNPNPLGLPTDTAIVDRQFVENPMLQRGPYNFQDLESKYPVRSVLPQAQVQTIPLQQQIAMNEIRTQQMAQQASLQGMNLHNQAAQADLTWTTGVHAQAEQGLQKLGDLDPTSPEYANQRVAFVKAFPLGVQSQALQAQLQKLDHTNQIINQSAQAGNHLQAQQAQQELNQARQLLASDPQGLAQFENLVASDPNASSSPTRTAAGIAIQRHQENLISGLKSYGEDISKYRIDPQDQGSPIDPEKAQFRLKQLQDDEKIQNEAKKKAAMEEAYTGRDMTQRESIQVAQTIQKLKEKQGAGPLDETDQGMLDSLTQQYNQFLGARGIKPVSATTPAAPAKYQDGQTAVNKATGQRMVFKNGNWQPVQ